ncbi:MAG TPA: hypothetical protein VE133_15835, partial [Candidatus Sulfotelmatobacter sp.]|nr:hypothetical protein [Candidatus Sulfotelmatobacter sp.]
NSLTRLLRQLEKKSQDHETLERAYVLASLFATMPFPVNYWNAQNIYYKILNREFPALVRKHGPDSRTWQNRFLALGEKLHISVPEVVEEAALPIAG